MKNLNNQIGEGAIALPIPASTSGVFQGTGASTGSLPAGAMNPGTRGRVRGHRDALAPDSVSGGLVS